MKPQSSLIATLLVILESIAVVGFLFLIFAVGANQNNVGKYQYQIQVNTIQNGQVEPLANAVISLLDQGKKNSFYTNEQGQAQFRWKKALDGLTIAAKDHVTQHFDLQAHSEKLSYQETFVVSKLEPAQKKPQLNLPYEFKVSVYDAEQNASFSSLTETETASDAEPAPVAKKTLDDASLGIEQGAVLKETLGRFQVLSKLEKNTIYVQASGYLPQEVSIQQGSQPDNHYRVYLQKDTSAFRHILNLSIQDPEGQAVSANLALEQGGAIQKQKPGHFQVFTSQPHLKLDVQAAGFLGQTLELNADTQKDYQIILQREAKRSFLIRVSDRKEQAPIVGAVVTIQGKDQSQTKRSDETGTALLEATNEAQQVMIAAPGFITQTFDLPLAEEGQTTLEASYQLRTNPMSSIAHHLQVTVSDSENNLLEANVTSTQGFVSQEKKGLYRVYAPAQNLRLQVTAPGYETKTIDLTEEKLQENLAVSLRKAESGVVLNTEIGDRLILSKGVVYRVVQPISATAVKVYRRTDPEKGEFNDYPQGRVMSLAQFNQEIEQEKQTKNFYDENVWITVYALNRNEYMTFKDVYRNQWGTYKLVYSNRR